MIICSSAGRMWAIERSSFVFPGILDTDRKSRSFTVRQRPEKWALTMHEFIWCYVSAIVLRRNVQSWNWTRPQSQQRKTLEITGSPYLTISCIACRTPRPNQSPNEPPTWICPKCVGWERKVVTAERRALIVDFTKRVEVTITLKGSSQFSNERKYITSISLYKLHSQLLLNLVIYDIQSETNAFNFDPTWTKVRKIH